MVSFKDNLDEVVKNIDDMIIDYHENDEPLFKITCEKKADLLTISNSLQFNNTIMKLFELLLSSLDGELGSEELVPPLENDVKRLFLHFLSDIRMSMLKEAVINLSNSFVDNKIDDEDIIGKELFFYYPDFADQFDKNVKKYYKEVGLDSEGKNAISNIIEKNKFLINLKFPKSSFLWYIYAICHTIGDLPTSNFFKKFYIVNKKFLSLHWIRINKKMKIGSNEKVLIDSQKKFKFFINILNYKNGDKGGEALNKSLNLYMFNEMTNLVDLHLVISNFKKYSPFINFKTYIDVSTIILKLIPMNLGSKAVLARYKKNIKDRKGVVKFPSHIASEKSGDKPICGNRTEEIIKPYFVELAKIAAIKHLGVKTYLINNYSNNKLFAEEVVWIKLNLIFDYCKEYIIDLIKNYGVMDASIKDPEIRLNYYIYKQLYKEEPYLNLLEEIQMDEIPIYKNSKDVMKNDLYTAYYYIYNNWYKNLSSIREDKNWGKY